jgi:transcription initiation factor TFIIH subunit 1
VTSLVRGSATYKKKDGTLSISKDQKSVQWLPLGARDPDKAMTIAVAKISSRWSFQTFSI